MLSFVAIFILLHVLLGIYLYLRFVSRRPGTPRAHRAWSGAAIALAFLLGLSGPFAYRMFHLPVRGSALNALYWVSYGMMGFLATLSVFSLFYDLGALPWRLAKRLRKGPAYAEDRRRFLADASRVGVLAAAGLSSGIGIVQAQTGPELKRVTVPVSGLHPDLDGFTIAQVSDLHIGPLINRAYVEKVVGMVQELKADLIALTGDFVDGSVEDLSSDAEPLRSLSAPHGIHYCTGNHEFYSGVGPWLRWFRDGGFQVLENEHRVLNVGQARLVVAGIHDYSAGRRGGGYSSDPVAALAGAPAQDDLKLLLAHQPRSCFQSAPLGFDLQLSGHTHAGQFFPFSLFVYFAHPYLRGLHLHEQAGKRMWVYVNQGTGYWGPPYRTGIPSEVTLLTLRRAET